MGLRNTFGYSLSREALFDSCRRRYYLHYYFSWGGWNPRAPAIVREAFRLKRLVSLSLWRGQLVHYVASKILQSMRAKGRIPDRDKVLDYTAGHFDRQFEFSRERRYLVEPKKSGERLNRDWLAIFEHEYGLQIDQDRIERARLECREAIDSLLGSPILRTIAETDPQFWFIEDLDRAEFSQTFQFEGITVYVKTDFTFKGADGTHNIVDWKTRRAGDSEQASHAPPKNAALQLGIYGYHAATIEHVPLDAIRLWEVNLLEGGKTDEHLLDEENLNLSCRCIRAGISKLTSVLAGGDPQRNEPQPLRCFPRIDNGTCRFCNFYRICKDEDYRLRLPDEPPDCTRCG